jgi:hypothetical protein
MKQDKLTVLANLVELVYSELKHAANDEENSEQANMLLKEASIDSINLKRKIEEARAWNVHKKVVAQ